MFNKNENGSGRIKGRNGKYLPEGLRVKVLDWRVKVLGQVPRHPPCWKQRSPSHGSRLVPLRYLLHDEERS